ncbi:Inosine/uridine-preferring nucleoside hydrolase [Penicillium bovifimosum]|uniref:Inosine/uridine-preferring nucleoside hydrolase n=1 Tax=Penicillium bovifimosum TaxID=126998 RepID=A0A9W9L193_9EURO|nr:Inosine/uridine-preferring nucleoside hydrolase [Penicillium bovifimosum]KAJ5130924.1 Inosine/uridine-preferring nucleoside hydrolase [Penicillium bovifimosum]
MDSPIPLWLDCDPGHDDAFAILIAAHHPSLELLGISTIHGNASLVKTTANAGSVLEAIGKPDIPVYPGCNKPFCRPALHAPDIHGESGLDGTDLLPKASKAPITDENAIVAMRNALLAQPKGTPWLVATGTLTNVALLFATFPEVAEHIQGLSLMGGAIGGGFTDAPMSRLPGEKARIGNTTPWAEFNLYCDPESSESIFSNPVLAPKTTIIALDLTHQVLASQAIQTRILHGSIHSPDEPTILRQILHALLTFFAATYEKAFGLSTGPPLHDPLAVAVVLSTLNPAFANKHPDRALFFDDKGGERFALRIVTDGHHGKDVSETGQLGRSIATPVDGPGVAVPRGVDIEAFWDMILQCVQLADDCNAARKI